MIPELETIRECLAEIQNILNDDPLGKEEQDKIYLLTEEALSELDDAIRWAECASFNPEV